MQWETKRCVGVTYILSFWPSHTCRVSLGHLLLHRLAITRNKYTRTIVNKDNCPTLIIGTHDIHKLVAKFRNNLLNPWDTDKIFLSSVLNWNNEHRDESYSYIFGQIDPIYSSRRARPLPGPRLLYDRKCFEGIDILTRWHVANKPIIYYHTKHSYGWVMVGRASSRCLRHKSRVTWHQMTGARATCPSHTSITYQDANYCYLPAISANFLYSSSGPHARLKTSSCIKITHKM